MYAYIFRHRKKHNTQIWHKFFCYYTSLQMRRLWNWYNSTQLPAPLSGIPHSQIQIILVSLNPLVYYIPIRLHWLLVAGTTLPLDREWLEFFVNIFLLSFIVNNYKNVNILPIKSIDKKARDKLDVCWECFSLGSSLQCCTLLKSFITPSLEYSC